MKHSSVGVHPFETRSEGVSQKTPKDRTSEFVLKNFPRYHWSKDNEIFSSPLAGEDEGEGEISFVTPTLSLPRQG
jgi:hypothetical protein